MAQQQRPVADQPAAPAAESNVASALAKGEASAHEVEDSLIQPLKTFVFSVREGVISMRAYEQVERA